MESFGETRSFFFASILNPNIQEFKEQKKASTYRANTLHSEFITTPTSKINKQKPTITKNNTVAL